MTLPIAAGGPGSVGIAYIEMLIRDRTREGVDKAMDRLRRDADKVTKGAGKALGDKLAGNMEEELEKPSVARRLISAIQRAFKRDRTKVVVPVELDENVDHNSLRRFTRNLGQAISRGLKSSASGIASATSGLMSGITGAVGGGLKAIGSSVGNVSSSGPLALVTGGLVVALIMALVGAVSALLAVFAPLLNIVLLLPSGLAVLGAAIFPLIIAFNGLGTAIGAIVSGDPEQIEEAFKGISKSAQAVLKDLQPLLPWFRDFGRFVQEAFFSELDRPFSRLQRAIGPEVITGFQRVARAAGSFADSLVRIAENPIVGKFLDRLFTSTANIFKGMEGPIGELILGLSHLGIVSLPYVEKAFAKIGGWIEKLAGWMEEISNNGEFKVFMDKLSKAGDNLWRLAQSGWSLIKSLMGGAEEQGRAQGFFDNLIATIDSLTYFFESDIGQLAIQGMITLAETFLFLLLGILVIFGLIASAIEGVRLGIVLWVNWLAEAVKWVDRLINKFGWLRTLIGPFIKPTSFNKFQGNAEGSIITSPTLSTLAEGGRPEVVIPLTDAARARELANQSGLTSMLTNQSNNTGVNFGTGAIQVSFVGVVPTQEEAFRTGAAVGSGIQDQLARRNTRLAVRTM